MPSEDGERVICIILLQAKLETEGNNIGQGIILFFCYANVLLSKICKVTGKDKRSEAARERNSPLLHAESYSLTERHMLWKSSSCCKCCLHLKSAQPQLFPTQGWKYSFAQCSIFPPSVTGCVKHLEFKKSVQRRAHRVHGEVSGGITLWILRSYFTTVRILQAFLVTFVLLLLMDC